MLKIQKATSPRNARSDTHTDRPLTNMLLAHYQDEDAFIADKVFPTVPVSRSTDFFYEIPRGALNKSQMVERARGAIPTIGNFDYAKIPFLLKIYALMVAQTDEDEMDMDEIIDWDMDATMFLNQQSKLRREISFNENFFKAGVWGVDRQSIATGTPSGNQFKIWSDDASTPIRDIKAAKKDVLRKTGVRLNTLTIDEDTKDVLTEHPEIIDRINRGQTNGTAKPTMANLAELFEVDKIHVGHAVMNDAPEQANPQDKNATASTDFIMNNGALLTFTPKRTGKRVISSGYNFVWKIYSQVGIRMRKHRENLALSDFHIIDDAYSQQKVAGDLGVFFNATGALGNTGS